MSRSVKDENHPLAVRRYALVLAFGWTVLVTAIVLFVIREEMQDARGLIRNEARAHFYKDQAFRYWGAAHGGVYVPPTEHTPPNPNLSHITDRDIVTTEGKELTLMNPAYMVRQLMEDYEGLYGVKGHITSLKPLRPENAPDEWERAALESFELGITEANEFSDIDGKSYLRQMRPLITKEACLKCHGHQGYKVGDVRGGVGVSVPAGVHLAEAREELVEHGLTMGLFWLLGMVVLSVGARHLNNRIHERDRAEKALRENVALLREMAQNYPNSYISIIESDYTVGLTAGQQFKKLNLDPDQFVGQTLEQVFGDQATFIRQHYEKTFEGEERTFELFIFDQYQLYRTVPLYSENGSIPRILVVVEDVTECKRADQVQAVQLRLVEFSATHSTRELLQKVLDESEILTRSEIGFYHFLDDAQEVLSLQSWSTNTLKSMCTAEGSGDRYAVAEAGVWVDCLREGKPVIHNDYASLSHKKGLPEGHAPLIRELIVPVIRGGKTKAILGVGNKKTDYNENDVKAVQKLADLAWETVVRRQAEEALRKSESTLNAAQGIAHIGSWELDLVTNTLHWSDEVYRLFDLLPQQFAASYEAFLENIHPDDRAMVDKAYTDSVRNRTAYNVNHRLLMKDGTIKFVNERCETFYDDAGNVMRSLGTIQDITESTLAEKELERQQYYLTKAQEIGRIGTWTMDLREDVLTWTEENYRIFGVPLGTDLNYEIFLGLVHPDDREYVEREWKAGIKGKPYDIEHRLFVDGRIKWVREKAEFRYNDKSKPISAIGFTQDITERIWAERNARDLARIVERSLNEIYIFDADTLKFLHANNGACGNIGYTIEELVKLTPADVMPEFTIDSLRQFVAPLRDGTSEILTHETVHKRKDGTLYEIESNLQLSEFFDEPVIVAIILDITETKRLREQKSRAERLELAGTIAGQVAHDFNNLLAPLMAYPELIHEELPPDNEAHAHLDLIEETAEKMAEINQDLLTLGRRGQSKRSIIDLNSIVLQATKELKARTDSTTLVLNLSEEPVSIRGGKAQIYRLLSNLLVNAQDAMDDMGQVTIRTENYFAEGTSTVFGSILRGQYVKLTLSDTGHGIPVDILQRILDPFFSTKTADEKRGSGLGLSIVDAVMKDHGGYLDLSSEVGHGTSFYLYFPSIRSNDGSEETSADKTGSELSSSRA